MRVLIFILILCLSIQNSQAGKRSGLSEESATSVSSTRIAKTPRTPSPLDSFAETLRDAAHKQEAFQIEEMYDEFQKLTLSEAEWQRAAVSYGAKKWPHQSTWKGAVGGQIFLDAVLDVPHQNLLRNGLKPLLSWVEAKTLSLDEAYDQALSQVQCIIRMHPYLRRRTALYGLASAARLQHPLARLFVTEALGCFDGEDTQFFEQNHTLIKVGLRDAQDALRRFIDVPGIEAFVDLAGNDLKDLGRLRQKATLGLIHYNVLLGDMYRDWDRSLSRGEDNARSTAIQQYVIASGKGDFEGYYNAAILIHSILSEEGTRHSDGAQWGDFPPHRRYMLLSALGGYEKAYRWAHICSILDKCNVEGTDKAIFKALKKFLTLRG